jgi:hypothetical protein
MVEATQESTKAFNNLDYNDPRGRGWSESWASLGISWRPAVWGALDIVINWTVIRELSPGYDLRVFSGAAPDQYPANYIDTTLDFRMLALIVLGHPADIVFSRDGIDPIIEFRSRGGYLDAMNARYFKIRNTDPGFIANYQLVVIN